jgi:hypothetical protein
VGKTARLIREARTARGQTNMGDGQVARVARWLATLKASVKLVPLGRLGKLKRRLNLYSAARLLASSGMFWEFFIGRDKGLIPRSGRRYRS